MSSCNCMGGPNCCKYQPRIGEYCRDSDIMRSLHGGADKEMPDIFGGPTLEDLHELWAKQDAPKLATWQCPGCGTYYAYWVSHCDCQKRNMVTSGNSTTLPQGGTFT